MVRQSTVSLWWWLCVVALNRTAYQSLCNLPFLRPSRVCRVQSSIIPSSSYSSWWIIATSIEVLTSAAIIRNIQVFNAGWPLALSVTHWKLICVLWINCLTSIVSWGRDMLSLLIGLLLLMLVWGLLASSIMIIGWWLIRIDVLVNMIFQRRVTSSKCSTTQISIRITTLMYATWLLLIVLLLLTAFIVYLSIFLPWSSIIILLSSTILLLLFEHAFVILYLPFDAGLHVIVFLSRSDATRCFSFSNKVVVFLRYWLFS